jgi:hypothetical protein
MRSLNRVNARYFDDEGGRLRLRKCRECGRIVAIHGTFPRFPHAPKCSMIKAAPNA